MSCSAMLVGLSLVVQVPPPSLSTTTDPELEAARRSLVGNQTAQLSELAEQLVAHRGFQIRRGSPRADSPPGSAGWTDPDHAARRSSEGSSRGKGR